MSEYLFNEFDREFNWDTFVKESSVGTIFHKKSFLSYHKERFEENERFFYFKDNKGKVVGVIPFVIEYVDGEKVFKSPYGGSYGGIATNKMNYKHYSLLVSALKKYLVQENFNKCILTLPISTSVFQDESIVFTYLEQGFSIINSDISSVVDLRKECGKDNIFNSKLRSKVKVATRSSVICKKRAPVEDFYFLMEKTFHEWHGKEPTHSRQEWSYLCEKLPEEIWCNVAYINDVPVAGVGNLVINKSTSSCFYLCQDREYLKTRALTKLIIFTMEDSFKEGFLYYDMGTSSVGMRARSNIFEFKESFGALGNFRYTLQWERENE